MKENFKISNNPFNPFGTIGRLGYFLTKIILNALTVVLIFFTCKTGIITYGMQEISMERSPLQIFLYAGAKDEALTYTLIVLATAVLSFIVNKKRLMHIAGDRPYSIRNSYLLAFAIACLTLMVNLFLASGSILNAILATVLLVISIFLVFKKGAPQAAEQQNTEKNNVEEIASEE